MPFTALRIDLDASKVVATVRRLRNRIDERFPGAGLVAVADKLRVVAEATVDQVEAIRRPNLLLRIAIWLCVASIPVALGAAAWSFRSSVGVGDLAGFVAFFQTAVESLFFIGVGIFFLVTLEDRAKRGRALRAVHNLRVIAHLVDSHQLDKDPHHLLDPGPDTKSSPERTLTAFELGRYLDYCSEMLAVIGKIGALYGQHLHEPIALNAVDQVEALTTGLSRKIWQKMMLLDRAVGE